MRNPRCFFAVGRLYRLAGLVLAGLDFVSGVFGRGGHHTNGYDLLIEVTAQDVPLPDVRRYPLNETKLKAHVDEVVRGRVEETLHTLLDAEADCLDPDGGAAAVHDRVRRAHGLTEEREGGVSKAGAPPS
ncbi:MAG TPA: hypothetical protein PLE61_02100 [Vicinamibacterales bacterium]|nr:hypothetical protein [Vicinamibacterales bacterium]